MQQCQVRVFSTIFVPCFDPNEWCLKNGLRSGGFNPGPLGHESSAVTTKPRLLACITELFLITGFVSNKFLSTLLVIPCENVPGPTVPPKVPTLFDVLWKVVEKTEGK
jgi:hypothetical protein